VVRSIIAMDTMSPKCNLKKFEQDVDEIIDQYLTLPWHEFKIGELFYGIFNIAFLHHIKIPREFALLAKCLATLQGLLEELAPDLNVLVVARPVARKLAYQSFSLKNINNSIKNSLLDYKELFSGLPSGILNVLGKVEDGDLTIQFQIKDIDNIQRRFDRVFNRISFSLVLLAVSIVIAGIIIGSSLNANAGSEIFFFNITIFKIGLVFAGVIVLGLIISMFTSNRL